MQILFMLSLLHILLFSNVNTQDHNDKWHISIKQQGQLDNNLIINYGLYSNITIVFVNTYENPTHCSGTLNLTTQEIQTPEGDAGIAFDTSIATEIKTHIGRSFKSKPSANGDQYEFQFVISSSQSSIITSNLFIVQLTIPSAYLINLSQSNPLVSFYLFAKYEFKPEIDEFYNVDPIEINFKKGELNSGASMISNCIIAPFPEKSTMSGYYTIIQFDFIVYPQSFHPEVIDFSEYIIINGQIEFSLNEESIKMIETELLSQLVIMDLGNYKADYSLEINDIFIDVFPSVFSCAVYCTEVQLNDDDIRNQIRGTHSKERLQFYKETIDKRIVTQMRFEGLSHLCYLKMKCLLDVNRDIVPNPLNFKSVTFLVGDSPKATIGESIRLGLREFIETNCCTWIFSNEQIDKKAFEDKAISYFNQLHITQQKEKDQGCFNYISRTTSMASSASICLIPLITCSFIPLYDYHDLFEENIERLSSTDKLTTQLELNPNEYSLEQIIHESDAYRYNTSNIKSLLIKQTDEYVVINVTTLGLPAECSVRMIDQVRTENIYEDDFYIDLLLTKNIYPNQTTQFNVPFALNAKEDEIYSIYMNCLNLPSFDHYHYFQFFPVLSVYFTSESSPLPDKEQLKDCGLKDNASVLPLPHCKTVRDIKFPADRSLNLNLDNVNYVTFSRFNISQQLQYVSKQDFNQEAFSEPDLRALNFLSSKLSLIKCLHYPSYTQCRKMKMDIHNKILSKILKTYRTLYTDDIPGYDSEREAFRLQYTNALFYLSSNYDLFTSVNAKEFMDLIYSHIDIFTEVMLKFTSEHKLNVITLFTTVLDSSIDLMHFVEIDDGLISEGVKVQRVNDATRLIPGVYNVKLKKYLETMLFYHKKYNMINNIYSNFIYNSFSFCSKGSEDNDEVEAIVFMDEEASSVSLSSFHLRKLNVEYFLAIIYSSFPLLSFNNTLTYSKVITLKAFDSNDKNVEVNNLPINITILYQMLNVFPWKHCGMFNETSLAISYNTIHTSIYPEDLFRCDTTSFSDYLLTINRYIDDEPIADPSGFTLETWMIIVIVIGIAVLGIAIGIGVFFYKKEKSKIKVVEKKEENEDSSGKGNISLIDLM